MEKEFFMEQHSAAGIMSRSLTEAYNIVFPENRFAVKSVDPLGAYSKFTTPWAKDVNDEHFFFNTMKTLGTLLKDDNKLETLYTVLTLSTPGGSLALKTKNYLQETQTSITFLMYRYLKRKFQDDQQASDLTSQLLKLIGDLHMCREIHLNRRKTH